MINFLTKAGAVVALSLVSVSAQAVTFAQFFQIKSANAFGFTNNDVTKKGVTTLKTEIFSRPKGSSSAPIVSVQALIDGIAGSGVTAGSSYNAYLSFDATSSLAATDGGGSVTQWYDSGELTLTSVDTGQVFVDAVFTNGALTGTIGAGAATFSASDAPGGTLTYSSDVFDILNTNNNFSLSISGLTKAIGFTPGFSINHKYNANGALTGSFASDTAVPEPATLALFGLGMAAIGLRARRAR